MELVEAKPVAISIPNIEFIILLMLIIDPSCAERLNIGNWLASNPPLRISVAYSISSFRFIDEALGIAKPAISWLPFKNSEISVDPLIFKRSLSLIAINSPLDVYI